MLTSFVTVTVALAALSVQALPLQKRVAQVIVESTSQWEQACLAAGGGQQCNPLSVAAFSTLLAAPPPCAQQDAADNMIDLAKQLGNDPEMIRLTQIFRQQPRNAPDNLSSKYCQTQPRNAELSGLFQCQFEAVNDTTFTGGVAVGGAETIPLGLSSPVSPPGSCPANPGGPIPDGVQLRTLVQNPGSPGNGNNDQPPVQNPVNNPPVTNPAPAATVTVTVTEPANCQATTAPQPQPQPNTGNNNNNQAPQQETPPPGAKPFTLQNGKDAQALNAQFKTLTTSSQCQAGQNACIDGGFSQCVNGQFVVTGCPAGLQCFALPLVNSAGTSLTCDTVEDARARIAATGAQGGIDGSE